MKAKVFSVLAAMAMVGFIYAVPAHAEDKTATDKTEHDGHHPEATAPAAKDAGTMGDKGMMGKMDMSQMQGMMHECMAMHKDGKMCDHDMMEKCQSKMGKGECQKMMKEAKASKKK